MNNDELTLGQKISAYRKSAKMSQLDLEIAINAGQGSISRIENDQVNPTKETINKLIQVLSLNELEAADLFGINLIYLLKETSYKSFADFNSYLIKMLDIIMGSSNAYLSAFFIIDEESKSLKLLKVYAPKFVISFVERFSRKKIFEILYRSYDDSNLFNRALRSNDIQITTDLTSTIEPVLGKNFSTILVKSIGEKLQSIIAVPVIVRGNQYGVLALGWRNKSLDKNDLKLIETLVNQIKFAITNA